MAHNTALGPVSDKQVPRVRIRPEIKVIVAVAILAIGAVMMFDGFSSVDSDLAEAIFGAIAVASAVAYLVRCARAWLRQ
jgi:uncharacterized MnhB-related membrane protein